MSMRVTTEKICQAFEILLAADPNTNPGFWQKALQGITCLLLLTYPLPTYVLLDNRLAGTSKTKSSRRGLVEAR